MIPSISIIAALSENRVIGHHNRLPWHIKEDLIRFKEKTTGHVVILGRKTYISLLGYYQRSGRPPDRIQIVVTKNKKFHTNSPKTYLAHSLEAAFELARKLESNEIFIAGGAQIFSESIKFADKLYLTLVKGQFEGDAYFPDYSEFNQVRFKQEGKSGDYEYTFLDLERY